MFSCFLTSKGHSHIIVSDYTSKKQLIIVKNGYIHKASVLKGPTYYTLRLYEIMDLCASITSELLSGLSKQMYCCDKTSQHHCCVWANVCLGAKKIQLLLVTTNVCLHLLCKVHSWENTRYWKSSLLVNINSSTKSVTS